MKGEGNWTINITAGKQPNYNSNETMYSNRFWLENLNVTYNAINVSPASGGWSRLYNYTINVSDPEAPTENVTCTLWISTNNQNTWTKKSNSTIYSGAGICSVEVHDFQSSDQGTDNYMKWEIDDGEQLNRYNTSAVQGPNITKSAVNLILTTGNNSEVNRSGNQIVNFIVRINDTENSSIVGSGVNISFYVTTDGNAFTRTNQTVTNSSGDSSAKFNPSCAFSNTGPQIWIAGVTNDTAYQDTNSTNFTTAIIGDMRPLITAPNGEKYLRGENNMVLRGNITGDCLEAISTASVNFTATHQNTQAHYVCEDVNNEGSGFYNCTFANTANAAWQPKEYDVKMNATLANYNYNETSESFAQETSGFWLETRPILSGASISSSSDGEWGETWTFVVNATDEDDDVMTIKLWTRKAPAGWSLRDMNSTVSGKNTTVTFTRSDLFDSGSVGGWEFNFTAEADDSWDRNETAAIPFNVDKDNINLTLVSGNDSIVNRSIAPEESNASFSVQVYDTDRNVALEVGTPGTAKIYTTTNPSDSQSFITDSSGSLTADGWINRTFPTLARCTYSIGPQKWRAEFGSSAYKLTNSSNFNVNLTTNALAVVILGPNNQTFRRGVDGVPLFGNVSDDCGGATNASIYFLAKPSGVWTKCQGTDVTDNNNGTYNCTLNPPATATLRWYNLTMNATKQYYTNSITREKEDSFVLATNPRIYNPTTNKAGNNAGWGEAWTYSATVYDEDRAAYSFEKMNVSLWIDYGTGFQIANSTLCSAITCSTPTAISFIQTNFGCGTPRSLNFKINVSDYFNYTNQTSSQGFTLEKDDVTLGFIDDPVSINREGSSSGRYTYRILDTDKPGTEYISNTSTNTSIYFTEDGENYTVVVNINPNVTGYANYDLNPGCTYSAGIQKWKAGTITEENCYKAVNLSIEPEFTVTGQLKNNLTHPYAGHVFNITQPITVNFTTLSDCSDQRADENPVINASTYTIELKSPAAVFETCLPVNNSYSGWYNCTWNSTTKQEGNWSVRINSSKNYFSTNSSTYTNQFWIENLNATYSNNNVVPATGGWSRNFTVNLSIDDPENDTITCTLFTNTTGAWTKRGQSTVVNGKGNCSVIVWNFAPEDVGNATYMFQLADAEPTNIRNTTVFGGLNITKPNVQVNYSFGNNSIVNRSTGTALLSVSLWDLDNLSWAPNVNATFWVTTDGAAYDTGTLNQTNSTGIAIYNFAPECTPYYTAGIQSWIGGVTDSRYVLSNTSINFSTIIYGYLNNTIIQPDGEEYLRGTNITARGNLTDECFVPISSATVNFTATSIQNLEAFSCSQVSDESTGYYNCTFNTSTPSIMPARWYNETMTSNKTYYNTQVSTKYQAFWIETTPVLNVPTATPVGDGGWGESWLFSANFTDEDLDNNWVKLWLNRSRAFDPTNEVTNLTVSGINLTIQFNRTSPFNENDYNTNRNVSFKLNATDAPPTGNPEDQADTGWQYIYLKPDNVSISPVEPVNLVFNRSAIKGEKILYSALIMDTDRNLAVPSRTAKFYYTKNGTNYTESGFIFIASGGNLSQSITMDCSYSIGPQHWIAGTANSTSVYAWEIKNSSIANFTIITENLTVNITSPINNTPWNAPRRNVDDIKLYADVRDDCGYVRGASLTFHVYDQGDTFDCTSITDYNNGTYSCTIPAAQTATWETKWHNISVDVSKQYYNGSSDFQENSFYLATTPEITPMGYAPITATPDQDGGWGEHWLFSAWVKDEDDDLVNVSLYLNLSGTWVLRNSTIVAPGVNAVPVEFYETFNCGNIGSDKGYKFVATDIWNYSDQENSTFNINKDDTTVEYITGSGEQTNREGNSHVLTQVRLLDSDRSDIQIGAGYNGGYYVTTQSSSGSGNTSTYTLYYTNQTDSSSILTFNFDPNCTIGVAVQNWRAGIESDSCYKDNQPEMGFSVSVKGQLKVGLISPEYSSNIPAGTAINVNSSVFSDCPNEGNLSNAGVSHEAMSPNNAYELTGTPSDQNNGFYNTTWNTILHMGGDWSFRLNASKSDYYSNSTLFANWTYLNNTPSITENFSVSPESGPWGRTYTYNSQIADMQQDNVTCDLYVSTNGGDWTLKNSTLLQLSLSGGYANCTLSVSNFQCNPDMGTNNLYKFQINDGTNKFNTSEISGPDLTEDAVSIEYTYGNNTIVNRTGTNTILFVARAIDTDKANIPILTNSNTRFWVTQNGANYDTGNDAATNSTGHANYNFDPTCSPNKYDVGPQYWKAGVLDSCYIETNTTQNYTATIMGSLINTIQSPDIGTEYLRDENISVSSTTVPTIQSDCIPEGVEGANAEIIFRNENGASNYSCNVEGGVGGYYTCTRNTTDMNARWYNTTMRSSMQYYNNGTSLNASHFFVKTLPVMTNETALTSVGGWGETFRFSVNLTDDDLDDVTLNLYTRDTNGGSWGSPKNTTIVSAPINRIVNLSWSDVPYCTIGTWEYYFEATDTHNPSTQISTAPKNFTIEKDDVYITHAVGNNSYTWRNGTYNTTLVLNITDADRRNISISDSFARFWVTTNASDTSSFDDGKDTMSS